VTVPQHLAPDSVPADAADLAKRLEDGPGYLPGFGLAAAAFLAHRMGRPLFLEGEPGVGKTAFASAMAAVLGFRCVRLQCHSGLDAAQSLYDWDFPRQLLALRAMGDGDHSARVSSLWSRELLIARPILDALTGAPAVLLIDEIDRADDEFEALLLQVLERYEIDIPEIGTVAAVQRPFVILTSNRTREVHDALKRRCLYHWISHPDEDHEVRILTRAVTDLPEPLARRIAKAMTVLRGSQDLVKTPGVAESIDLAGSIVQLGGIDLTEDVVDATISTVAKHHDDEPEVREALLDQGGAQ
jgi:MoxR-like ATPase